MFNRLSLQKRIASIAVVAILPLLVLVAYLMYIIIGSVGEFDRISSSVTYASTYVSEFKQKIDYSMYYAVIRGSKLADLEIGRTINGIEIVDPYAYIEEMRSACREMAALATVQTNVSRSYRIQGTLASLKNRIDDMAGHLGESGYYDTNMDILDSDIRSLTQTINDGIQTYINTETSNFARLKDELLAQSQQAAQLSIVTVLAAASVSVLLAIRASRSIVRPIKGLSETARQVASGDFTVHGNVGEKDEIAVLTNTFNDMTAKIGDLVEDIKREQSNLRLMETRLLQAQINPHFLYNTLDTIMWLAEAKRTDEVVSIVTSLSEFFRTTLSSGKDLITVAEERRHVESYLKIQQFRYQDILDYEISVTPAAEAGVIPKLSVQPLVENALYHGVKNKRGKGKITIRGAVRGDKIYLTVSDNGKGMSEAELSRLRAVIAGYGPAGQTSFGLNNVNKRIQHYFGREYGIFFESRENEGTEAVIIIPAKDILPIS